MSKVLKVVAVVAGVVAIAATGGAALAGAGTFLGMTSATLTTVATIASVTAAVASVGAQFLTKPPPARGSVAQIVVDPNAPRPYVMGEGYVGGVRRYDRAYGMTINDIPNPYRFIVDVYCGHGPVHSISPRFDFQPITSYYDTFLNTSTQIGNCPESIPLATLWGGAPNWDNDSKLSGCAAIGWNFKFDKDGKRYASGIPVMGAYGKWVKVYDPRLDSTYPGGLGSHRLGDESTYTWSENPALHFAMYAYGRFQNGRKVIGVGLPADGIDWPTIVAWANVCDANGWKIFGRAFEPGDRWAILKDIAAAGGGVPVFSGGMLSATFSAPRVSLGTISFDDLADGDASVTKVQTYSSRINTIVPKFIDPGSNWELMPTEPVSYPALVTEDGEERRQEFAFNFVKSATQAAQLGSYKVLSSREESPITLPLLPQWRMARPGECYTLDIPELDLAGEAVVIKREIDPSTFTVKLTFTMETPSKHSVALGTVGIPAIPVSGTQNGETRDDTAYAVTDTKVVSASMTPPTATLFAYANGNIVSLAPASGKITVFSGNTDVTSTATYAVTAQVNCTGAVNTAGEYAITAMTANTAKLTITASYGGKTIPLTFSVTKSYVGYEIVAALPTTGNFEGRVVFLTSDDKLYRYNGTAWTAAVPATDISGQLQTAQLADNIISASKFAAGIEPVGVVASVPTTKSTSTIYNSTDGKLYRWSGSAYVASVPTSDLTGTVSDAQIAGLAASKVTGTLSDSQLKAISAAKVTGQITTTQITDGAISTAKLAAGSVTANIIASDTITAANIAAGAISSSELAAGAVTTAKLAAGAVTANQIAAGAVTAGKVAAGAITATELAANAITAGKIAAGAVSASQLAAGAVTADKIAAGAITAGKLVLESRDNILADPGFNDLAVWDLANVEGLSAQTAFDPSMPKRSIKAFGAVGTIDRRSQYVPVEQGAAYRVRLRLYFSLDATGWIAPTIHIPMQAWFTPAPSTYRADVDNGTYPVIDLANTTIPKGQWVSYDAMFVKSSAGMPEIQARTRYNLNTGYFEMAWEIVRAGSADLIVDGAVTANKVAANAITAAKIEANAVTADKISAGAITAAKLAASNVVTLSAQISDAVVTNAKIANLAVDTVKIANQAVTIPISAYTSGSLSISANTWTTCQNATITSTGAPVSIVASLVQIMQSYSGIDKIRITRNGPSPATIYEASLPFYATGFGDLHGGLWSFNLVDLPGAGTHTYNLDFYQSKTTANAITNRSLTLIEVKK